MQSNEKRIICIEGVHGVGKTAYLDKLRSDNPEIVILDEMFIDDDEIFVNFPRQGMSNQVLWLTNW